jgi:hypothetical protein
LIGMHGFRMADAGGDHHVYQLQNGRQQRRRQTDLQTMCQTTSMACVVPLTHETATH